MVDFNTPEMYAKSSGDLEQYSIMEARYNVLNLMEHAEKLTFQGAGNQGVAPVKAALMRLLRHLKDEYGRSEKRKGRDAAEGMGSLKESIKDAKTIDELDMVFNVLDTFMDELGITKVDKESLGGNIVKRNRGAGLL